MRIRHGLLVVVLLGISTFAAGQTSTSSGDAGWKPLFDGRDLSGFYTLLKGGAKNEDPTHIFQVHDGILHIYKDAEEGSQQPFGYVCTEQELGDCRIRF